VSQFGNRCRDLVHLSNIDRIPGRIDTTHYLGFLKKVVSRNRFNTKINFVHDRYNIHRAKVMRKWFRDNEKKIELIP
jgi:hypothetical protein